MVRKTYTPYRSSKRSSKSRSKKSLNLFGKKVFLLIEKGFCPAQISKMLNVSKSNLSYYIGHLKASGAIEKIGYGVWKAHKFDEKKFKNCGPRHSLTLYNTAKNFGGESFKNRFRAHGYRFLVTIPILDNWSSKRNYMNRNSIDFKTIPHGERIIVRGHKVKLFRRSIEIYFKKGFSLFAKSGMTADSMALEEFKSCLVALQNLFRVNFGKRICWRVNRRHIGMIRHELAKDCLERGKKLEIRDSKGELWLLVDNSFNLEETECVSTKTAPKDADNVVERLLNDFRDNPDSLVLSELTDSFSELKNENRLTRDILKGIIVEAKETSKNVKGIASILRLEKDIKDDDEPLKKPDYFG